MRKWPQPRPRQKKQRLKKRQLEEAEAQRKAEEEAAQKAAEEAAAAAAAKEEAKGYETGITYDQLARTPDDYKGKKKNLRKSPSGYGRRWNRTNSSGGRW